MGRITDQQQCGSVAHLLDHPFADDEVDETYIPETESDSDSDYTSSEDEAL